MSCDLSGSGHAGMRQKIRKYPPRRSSIPTLIRIESLLKPGGPRFIPRQPISGKLGSPALKLRVEARIRARNARRKRARDTDRWIEQMRETA